MVALSIVLVGITLALIATCCFNFAIVLQKKGLKQGLPEFTFDDGVKSFFISIEKYFENKYWAIGFALSIIGWIPFTIAQGMVGIVVVQPIMGVGLIIMVIFANRMLQEKISLHEFVAMGMLIVAPFLIVWSGISNVSINLYEFLVPFLIFLVVLLSFIILCVFFARRKKGTESEGLYKIIIAGILFSLGAIFSNIFAQAFISASINLLSFFGWAEVLFGIFWFEYFHLWVFLGLWGMGIFNLTGLIFQQNSMRKGKAVVLWPIQNSITLIIPLIVGFLVFGQTVNNYFIFWLAIVLILTTTLILSKYQAQIDSIK